MYCSNARLFFSILKHIPMYLSDQLIFVVISERKNDKLMQNQYFLVFFCPICATTSLIVDFSLHPC